MIATYRNQTNASITTTLTLLSDATIFLSRDGTIFLGRNLAFYRFLVRRNDLELSQFVKIRLPLPAFSIFS